MADADARNLEPAPADRNPPVEPVLTLSDLLKSEVVGMWKDRDDMGDSDTFARRLRDDAWRSK